ncbi:MAG: MerR family transcriptional regulator [Bosea sp. (in: a-proteobacteria)]
MSALQAQTIMAADTFTIGDLAREYDVTLRALRFYESRGLLKPQRVGLTRLYSADDKARLALILKGKALGFTLQEIREMISGKGKAGATEERLNLSLPQIEEQLTSLRQQKIDIESAIVELERDRQRMKAEAGR